MPYNSDMYRIVDDVPFVDFMLEMMINRPDRAIAEISPEHRMKIYAFEAIVASHSDRVLMEKLAPWRVTGDEERILQFIHAIRLCIRYRRPEWTC